MDEHPRGFGLIQRDRDFVALPGSEWRNFQRRPSYWIQPLGDWGKGGVELVEIPTDEEIHDNIVAVLGARARRRAAQAAQLLLSAVGSLGLADVAARRQGDRHAITAARR